MHNLITMAFVFFFPFAPVFSIPAEEKRLDMDRSTSPSLFQIQKEYTLQKWTKNAFCFVLFFYKVLRLCAESQHKQI